MYGTECSSSKRPITCAGNMGGWSGETAVEGTTPTGGFTPEGRTRGAVFTGVPPQPRSTNDETTSVRTNATRAGKLRMAGPCQTPSNAATSWTFCHVFVYDDVLS